MPNKIKGSISSRGLCFRMKAHFWSLTFLLRDTYTTPLCEVRHSLLWPFRSFDVITVRCIPAGSPDAISPLKAPFALEGARNVFLETVKRGEYDSFDAPIQLNNKEDSPTTVVLRLYEAYGGHAQVRLVISPHIPIIKAFETNLLEDEDGQKELYLLRPTQTEDRDDSCAEGSTLALSFRGFEIKTVKLVLGNPPRATDERRS